VQDYHGELRRGLIQFVDELMAKVNAEKVSPLERYAMSSVTGLLKTLLIRAKGESLERFVGHIKRFADDDEFAGQVRDHAREFVSTLSAKRSADNDRARLVRR